MKMNKHALTALVVIFVLTFSACGVVGLTATRASAACNWSSQPTTGKVGEKLHFSLIVAGKPFPEGMLFYFDGRANDGTVVQERVPVTGFGSLGSQTLTYSTTYNFTHEGTYTVSAKAEVYDPGCTAFTVVITQTKNTQSELTGPTTGTAGDTLTYTLKTLDCPAGGNCNPASGKEMVLNVQASAPATSFQQSATTDAQGIATFPVAFQTAASYRIIAYQAGDPASYASTAIILTVTPTNDVGGTNSAGGAQTPEVFTPPAKTNETGLAIVPGFSGSASSPFFGIPWWVFGIALIILIGVIGVWYYQHRRVVGEEESMFLPRPGPDAPGDEFMANRHKFPDPEEGMLTRRTVPGDEFMANRHKFPDPEEGMLTRRTVPGDEFMANRHKFPDPDDPSDLAAVRRYEAARGDLEERTWLERLYERFRLR
jgi:hypothetical protein